MAGIPDFTNDFLLWLSQTLFWVIWQPHPGWLGILSRTEEDPRQALWQTQTARTKNVLFLFSFSTLKCCPDCPHYIDEKILSTNERKKGYKHSTVTGGPWIQFYVMRKTTCRWAHDCVYARTYVCWVCACTCSTYGMMNTYSSIF